MKRVLYSIMAGMAGLLVSVSAFATEEASSAAADHSFLKPALALAAGFGIAIAAFGGALGQGKAASAALEGIARNPGTASKVQTPMIIALALIESLVIYALVIAFLLQAKI